MGELNIDNIEGDNETEALSSNAPLVIALACALFLVALFVGVIEADAQRVSIEPTAAFGSLSGRVTAADENAGLASVKVLIRRIHSGPADFYFDRVTAPDGTFCVAELLPGRYTVEIDPRSLRKGVAPVKRVVRFVDVLSGVDATAPVSLAIDRKTAVARQQLAQVRPGSRKK